MENNTLRTQLGWLLRRLVILVVRCYQLTISPLIGPRCRYLPTCSAYFIEAVETHGAVTGTRLGIKRITRCHPWGEHGYDPVPEKQQLD